MSAVDETKGVCPSEKVGENTQVLEEQLDLSSSQGRMHPEEGEWSGGVGEAGGKGERRVDPPGPTALESPVDSEVYSATSLELQPKKNRIRTYPLTLDWAFGINKALPVFSLRDHGCLITLYVSAHVAVMHDHTTNTQQLLQGHCSPISCLCVSEDRRWLVTADRGRESLVIIWDSYTGIPVRTLFDCHPDGGVAAVALSNDSKYLATVGAGLVQRVCVWEWTDESVGPECVAEIRPEYGCQNHILFNPTDSTQLLSNSESCVIFYTRGQGSLEFSAPEISDKTFNKVVGTLSQSIFHCGGIQAFTASSAGNLVLWDMQRGSAAHKPSRKAIKLIPLQEEAITVLTQTKSYIVTGDVRGQVKFFDYDFKLISWYSEFNLDAIASISFSKEQPSSDRAGYREDCTLDAKPFVISNFVLSTVSATVAHMTTQGSVPETLLREHAEALNAVACHPRQPLVAMGSCNGVMKVWDYENKVCVCNRVFQKDREIQRITYDPQGFYLAVGFASGAVRVLEACTLSSSVGGEEDALCYSRDPITHLTFSQDSHYLACADAGQAVTVFRLCEDGGRTLWRYHGRHRSHHKPIQELLFGVYLDTTQPLLLSLGMDRRLVEYDLERSGEDQLRILSSERIEQSAVPTCMAWSPPLTTEHFLLTANDRFKMKLLNSTTRMCRKTVLGPNYGSPVKKMIILPTSMDGDPNHRYLAYITKDKVGVQILPLDGNPYNSSALICHPTGVSGLACSHDGRYIFTAGGADCTVFSWEISLSALEGAAALGGKDLVPFYSLLEGGRDGELFREMEDYFYYCQLRIQGIDSMETRQLSTRIPLSEVPFVMRALGFYPTEQELEDMQNEVKFSRYAETGKYVTDIDLEEFIKLYVNHRPLSGVSREELCWAFRVLGKPNEGGRPSIAREELLEVLQARGEHMTGEELAECFTTLLGFSPEEGKSKLEPHESKDSEVLLENQLPPDITMETFATDILGFPVATPEALANQDSSASPAFSTSTPQV